jgi:hypothetical protein
VRDAYAYTNSNADCNTNTNIDADTDSNTIGYANSDANSYGRNANTDTHLPAGRAPGRLRDDVGLRPERLEPDSSYQHS